MKLAMVLEAARLFGIIFYNKKYIVFTYLFDLKMVNIINFALSNQLWWATMIMHLKYYKHINDNDNNEYHKIKKRIRIIEIIIAVFFALIFLISNGGIVYSTVIQYHYNWVHKVFDQTQDKYIIERYTSSICNSMYIIGDDAKFWYKYSMILILIVTEILLYFVLSSELK